MRCSNVFVFGMVELRENVRSLRGKGCSLFACVFLWMLLKVLCGGSVSGRPSILGKVLGLWFYGVDRHEGKLVVQMIVAF